MGQTIRVSDRRSVEAELGLSPAIWAGREVTTRDSHNSFDPPCRYYEWRSVFGRVQLTVDGEIYLDGSDETHHGELKHVDRLAKRLRQEATKDWAP